MDDTMDIAGASDAKPVKQKKESAPVKEEFSDATVFADGIALSPWERAGLFKAAGWAPGKQVSLSVFTAALEGFRERRQGGGRINV